MLLAIPVLLLGEQLQQRVKFLARYHIPAPVIGGLLVAIVRVLLGLVELRLDFSLEIDNPWLAWIVSAPMELSEMKPIVLYLPLMVAFFASIGLAAPVGLLKHAGLDLPKLLALAVLLTILQNGLGVSIAALLGESPLLGMMCGSVALSGGHGNALGFATTFQELGFAEAPTVGAAAATFGLVFGGLVGGPLAAHLLKRYKLEGGDPRADTDRPNEGDHDIPKSAWLRHLIKFSRGGWLSLAHIAAFLLCLKLGAMLTALLVSTGIQVPVYVGAIIVGILVRNFSDLIPATRFLNSRYVEHFGAVCLDLFLVMALMTLRLEQLVATAGPMLLILISQVVLMVSFARFLTFRGMGKDYEAAVMSAGHCGFGLGATPTAIANMQAVTERFGHAPRAFLVLPIIGAFFIDVVNVAVITTYLNLLT